MLPLGVSLCDSVGGSILNRGRNRLISVVVVRRRRWSDKAEGASAWSRWSTPGVPWKAFRQVCESPKLHAMFCVRFSGKIHVLRSLKKWALWNLLPAVLNACFVGDYKLFYVRRSLTISPSHPTPSLHPSAEQNEVPGLVSAPFTLTTSYVWPLEKRGNVGATPADWFLNVKGLPDALSAFKSRKETPRLCGHRTVQSHLIIPLTLLILSHFPT